MFNLKQSKSKTIVSIIASLLTFSTYSLSLTVMTTSPAYSQDSSYINYFKEGFQQAHAGWANLTYQQQQIDRQIQAVLQSIGRYSLPVTNQNIIWMMQQINASPDLYTAGFVAGRMDVNAQATKVLGQTDSLLCSIGTQFNIPAGTAHC